MQSISYSLQPGCVVTEASKPAWRAVGLDKSY